MKTYVGIEKSLTETWKNYSDELGYFVAVLNDLSNAFNTINHDLFLAKVILITIFGDVSTFLAKNYIKWPNFR